MSFLFLFFIFFLLLRRPIVAHLLTKYGTLSRGLRGHWLLSGTCTWRRPDEHRYTPPFVTAYIVLVRQELAHHRLGSSFQRHQLRRPNRRKSMPHTRDEVITSMISHSSKSTTTITSRLRSAARVACMQEQTCPRICECCRPRVRAKINTARYK